MTSRMTMDLSPQLLECLARLEKLVGEKSKVELVWDALVFYEDTLNRALSGKKLVESAIRKDFEVRNNIFPLTPAAYRKSDLFENNRKLLRERLRRAAEAGLIPQQ